MDPSESGTSAELQLRQARSSIASLNRFLAEAEKGNTVPFAELQQELQSARAVLTGLSQGRLDAVSTAASISVPSGWQASNLHPRTVGREAVTDLQRRTAQQLLAELSLIETSLQRCQRKTQQRQTYMSEVEQLLGGMRGNGGQDSVSSLQHLESERSSLQYTRNRVRAMLDESNLVMKALQDQGGRLEGTDSKVADVLESIGVANSTVLQILRRNRVDAWLVYGGIALTILFLYYIW
ncbi:putative SNARE protein [Trypanosoma theileri]|uniref:Putative SNARE protein n=1 Tax=Trypanosoma theileri TaxID=67003 RepID=A0A1X0P6J5_9TRYP|nr:putative SNARE protein [Trypanosoma theileri]ORC92451.1 putative SNARE protein [Trypanosoma theileri]